MGYQSHTFFQTMSSRLMTQLNRIDGWKGGDQIMARNKEKDRSDGKHEPKHECKTYRLL